MLRRLRRTNSIVILMTSNKKSNHIVIFTLLNSHTTVQSTATSEIELRGDITQFSLFYGYFVATTPISEVAVLYLTFQG
jgi:hypothetical protein